MKQFIEATAVRIGTVIQNVCANVDCEVVSLPGGSLIAVLLWLYAIAIAHLSFDRARIQIMSFAFSSKLVAPLDSPDAIPFSP
jgi:hypothetical protein